MQPANSDLDIKSNSGANTESNSESNTETNIESNTELYSELNTKSNQDEYGMIYGTKRKIASQSQFHKKLKRN